MHDQGHMFSLKSAAAACEVAPITLRRRIKSGELPNAFKATVDGSETWQIPLHDLIAAGFPPVSAGESKQEHVEPSVVEEPGIVDELRSQLTRAEHRAELAEVELRAERRITTALEGQVRALQAGPPTPRPSNAPVALTEPVSTVAAPLRRRWWQRST